MSRSLTIELHKTKGVKLQITCWSVWPWNFISSSNHEAWNVSYLPHYLQCVALHWKQTHKPLARWYDCEFVLCMS